MVCAAQCWEKHPLLCPASIALESTPERRRRAENSRVAKVY